MAIEPVGAANRSQQPETYTIRGELRGWRNAGRDTEADDVTVTASIRAETSGQAQMICQRMVETEGRYDYTRWSGTPAIEAT